MPTAHVYPVTPCSRIELKPSLRPESLINLSPSSRNENERRTASMTPPSVGSVESTSSSTEAEYDADLVRRFNCGEEAAFNEIMSRYYGKILGLALNLLRNHADAEEIAQDTFLRVHRGLATFRGDSSLATWLYRIALNLARNRYWYFFRRRRQDSISIDRRIGEDSEATFGDFIAADRGDPAQQTVTNEFASLIARCMADLEPSHREILTMRTSLHLSYDEIAVSMGINVGTVKSRISRARESLRTLLAQSAPEFALGDTKGDSEDYFLPARPAYGCLGIAYA